MKLSTLKCLECNKNFKSESSLLKHLRTHKISQAVYFQRYFPRFDKYDNSLIKFKNKEYYFNTDFNTLTNLALWLDKVSPEE